MTATFFRIAITAAILAALPMRPANPQPSQKLHRLAVLELGSADSNRARSERFEQGLKDLGYFEGKNIVTERRYADGQADRLPGLAAELVRSKPDVIFAPTTPAALAAKGVSGSIPIVIAVASEPVGSGLAESLARPGGNVTGTSNIQTEIDAKRVQLVKEILPKVTRVALLHAGDRLSQFQLTAAQRGGRSLGIEIISIEARQAADYRKGFAAAKSQNVGAMLVTSNAQNLLNRQHIIELAAEYRLPAIYPNTGYINYGGLMSYGTASEALYYRAAAFVGKILKGAKPAELPIEQPTRFDLEINLKTAKALGLKIPQSIILRADKVIE
jgi:putative tryptophan/tyrosine transport system substrate-binding protein